ncbi:MerR family transcriptional regulator [Erysipelothrix sp. HDW6A]|uniref:MerR family transcriptional regulator n=1 Tax=Erysipelothrix sp. HDW6A TaxID=2714928 RepID=UPI00140C7388|nr:MerR family transcriptional regulator [Erysipelothrix sp. HDW6A]QIK57898.1 MerR family transcriptional regulator [Erysipelothrix sp. HDW6A]
MDVKYYSISDFSKRSNLPIRTLHYYDKKGVLVPSRIDESNGYRYYTESQVITATTIINFKLAGFSLDEIKQLIQNAKYETMRAKVKSKIHELHDEIRIKNDIIKLLESYCKEEDESIRINSNKESVIVYFRSIDVGNPEAIKKRYIELINLIKKFKLYPIGPMSLINHDDYRDYNKDSVDIEVFVEVSTSEIIPGVTRLLEAYYSTDCRYTGNYSSMLKKYGEMLKWIEENGFTYKGKTIEKYLVDWTHTENSNDFVTDLQIII